MNSKERYSIYVSQDFDEKVSVSVIDWAHYWAENGTSEIEDETLRNQTEAAVRKILEAPHIVVGRVKTLVIGDDTVKEAEEITDAIVKTAVDHAFTRAISYIVD